IEPAEKKEYYKVSSAQKRLYILQQMELESTAYNMPHVLPITRELSREKLGETFRKLIRRHESLRTTFHMNNDAPVQVVHEHAAFKIETVNIEKHETGVKEENQLKQKQREFFRPFDLAASPLLRVGIAETTAQRYLLIDMHHIITDGTSLEILIKEFNSLNKGENLPPLKLRYRDYAQWQNRGKQKQLIK
ncbi:MAG: hypothetical protein GY757_24430, partial [bacterium]|nr:hypothetical protein [bacterium]